MLTGKFFQSAQPFKNWHLFVPKIITSLSKGYGIRDFRADFIAGLTVAIVALPLAMALGIASGATPEQGLITVVIAGFLISLLGGSRFQIGGPTGAFVVVVFDVIAKFGYDGLIVATLMAGIMLIAAGLAKMGTWIKYIPQPVVTGFTSGIAVIIFSSQIKDLFGLKIDKVPGDFIDKWTAFWQARESFTPDSIIIAAGALAAIVLTRRYLPKFPGFLIAVIGSSLAVYFLNLQVPTIGNVFGELPRVIPAPHMPTEINFHRLRELLPSGTAPTANWSRRELPTAPRLYSAACPLPARSPVQPPISAPVRARP